MVIIVKKYDILFRNFSECAVFKGKVAHVKLLVQSNFQNNLLANTLPAACKSKS